MSANAVARRYVRALYDLAGEKNAWEAIGAQLHEVNDLLQGSRDLETILDNPAISPKEKVSLFDAVSDGMDLDTLTANFIRLLIRRDRIGLLGDMCEEFDRLERERTGILEVSVTTARALDDQSKQRFTKTLEESTGKKVEMHTEVDSGLIGGMVARIGSTVYDGSIAHQLARLQQRLGED
jgi:F-type H+-transporting ATPase subunit delta